MVWTPVSALPNLDVRDAIEGGVYALVPNDDERVRDLKRRHPAFRAFINRFTDTFRHRINPSLLLRWDEDGAPEALRTAQAAASFRDLLTASLIPRQRSLELVYERGHRIQFADYFWLYPWMTDRNYEHVIAATPGMLAIHDPRLFRGQQSPDLIRMTVQRSDFDEPLLGALIERWSQRYSVEEPTWDNTALFRSLNMAFHAMSFPGGAATTFHDTGRIIGLWIAAFEILVHAGNRNVGWRDVLNHLDAVAWEHRECAERVYEVGTPARPSQRNLACWIYKHLNDCRNDFFHGNPVGPENLTLPVSGQSLFSLAATLYRSALAKHINLVWERELPPIEDADGWGQYIADHLSFMTPQREVEAALLVSRVPEGQRRAERNRIFEERRGRRREGR